MLVSTFSDHRAAAKEVVDAVAAGYGFVAPRWYAEFRATAHAVGGAAAVERTLAASGFAHWTVTEEPVDVGLTDPSDVVRYRLAMPQLAPFVAALPGAVRAALVADAVEAVRATGEPFTPVVVEAVATV